jgi:hypothetical protein
MPLAVALPVPETPRRQLRLGLLQSRVPFIDFRDVAGSRDRAFEAYRVLIRRSTQAQGALDWLAGGAFALSGRGPFPGPVLEQLALDRNSAEIKEFSSWARAQRLNLTFGAWWRDSGTAIAHRMISFDSSGSLRVSAATDHLLSEGIEMNVPAEYCGPSLKELAAQCRKRGSYGASVEMIYGPDIPPGACPAQSRGSAVIGPDGAVLAYADAVAETCLVADV